MRNFFCQIQHSQNFLKILKHNQCNYVVWVCGITESWIWFFNQINCIFVVAVFYTLTACTIFVNHIRSPKWFHARIHQRMHHAYTKFIWENIFHWRIYYQVYRYACIHFDFELFLFLNAQVNKYTLHNVFVFQAF